MHKKGFTLAEVLITLSVIGVVAALTIPGLVRNYQETQWKATVKKTYSELVQATQMLLVEHNGDFTGVFNLGNVDDKYCKFLKCAKRCYYNNNDGNGDPTDDLPRSECFHNDAHRRNNGQSIDINARTFMVLKSGVAIAFYTDSTTCEDDTEGFPDNEPVCVHMFIDVNGFKGPNKFGDDIFAAAILKDKMLPYGIGTTQTCTTGVGYGCLAKVLKNEDY